MPSIVCFNYFKQKIELNLTYESNLNGACHFVLSLLLDFDEEMLKLLIKNGADLDLEAEDEIHRTPL